MNPSSLLTMHQHFQQPVPVGAPDIAAAVRSGHGLSAERWLHLYHHADRVQRADTLADIVELALLDWNQRRAFDGPAALLRRRVAEVLLSAVVWSDASR